MTGKPSVVQNLDSRGLEKKIKTFKANKSLSNYQNVDDNVDMSAFEGLSLKEYLEVKHHICTTEHHQPCSECSSLIEVANAISREGYMRLNKAIKQAWDNRTLACGPIFCFSTNHCIISINVYHFITPLSFNFFLF